MCKSSRTYITDLCRTDIINSPILISINITTKTEHEIAKEDERELSNIIINSYLHHKEFIDKSSDSKVKTIRYNSPLLVPNTPESYDLLHQKFIDGDNCKDFL